MELGDGMVCVVRGVQDAALCVTLLDGSKQYTLMPNAAVPQDAVRSCVQSTQKPELQAEHDRHQSESSAQAVDGRYASIYKAIRSLSPEEQPTRDNRREDCKCKRAYGRSYDVRYVRDIARKAKESVKSFSTYPYNHPVCPTIIERYDHLPPEQKNLTVPHATNSMNMETQAEVPMVSREVATLPRVQPPMRNVAVPLSPTSSNSDAKPESIATKCSCKSIQTTSPLDLTLQIRKSVQTCFSSVDLLESKKVKNKRKSRSQEELRANNDFEEEVVKLIQDLTSCPDLDGENVLRIRLLRKLRKLHKINRSERVKIKIGRCIKDQPYSEIDLKSFTRDLSNELISKIKRYNVFIGSTPTNVYRSDVNSLRKNIEDNCVDEIIKEWLNDIPIKTIDYLGRDVKKGHLLQTIADRVRTLIINKLKYNSDSTMKEDIIEIIEDVPIDINGHNKRFYLNRLVSELIRKIKDIFTPSQTRRRSRKSAEYSCSYIQPTENEMRQFVKNEITEFTVKFHLKICAETLKQIEIELTGILLDSLEIIRLGYIEDIKEDILVLLSDFIIISEQHAIYFANNVIHNLKDIFEQSNCINKPRSQTFIILQNTNDTQVTPINNTDFSIEGINEGDIERNLEFYTNLIVQQITEWSKNIQGFDVIDPNLRKVVINDLACDIVDRHKYLELNPAINKNSHDDELDHLKYQIFKWINKVMGENNFDTISHASELMKRIRSLPVPMLTKPHQNIPQPPSSKNVNYGQGVKSDTVQETSKGRRLSSPGPMADKPGTTDMKQYKNHNRRQSSPGGIFIPENISEPDAARNETTESRFDNSIGATSTPKKKPHSRDPDMSQIRIPQGPFGSMMEPPDRASDQRMSGSAGFPTKSMTGESRQRPRNDEGFPSTSRLGSSSRKNKASCCTNTHFDSATSSPSIKKLNEDYDEFVKNWVQEIPIATTSPEEQAVAEKARLGIYNGIWIAITKLKMDPATMNNPFYYQDVFDDELEDLLGCLPQTHELTSKKHMLKAKLIEKTSQTNELILATASPSNFKQQLLENVSNKLPRNKINYAGKDVARLYEEMQKMNLAEDFILYIKYREDDKVKANVYKKKLMREAQELINGIKASHGKELKDIDAASYIDEVIIAMQKVPLPSDDTIAKEADEIAIGLEIEQWFSDLPLVPNDDYVEKLGRRRYQDALAKKIHDLEKQRPLAECEKQVKEEVRRFLERMPLRAGLKENINFMVEEIVNRLKNRTNDFLSAGGGRRKSVAFLEAYDYNEFSRDMPMCSSFTGIGRAAQANQSSYMIADGTRVEHYPYGQYIQNRDATPESQQQWYTLEETKIDPRMLPDSSQNQPPCCRGQLGVQNSDQQFRNSGQLPVTHNSSQTPAPVIREISASRLNYRGPSYEEQRTPSNQRFDQSAQRFENYPRMSRVDFDQERASYGTGPSEFNRQSPGECDATCRGKHAIPGSYKPEGTTRPTPEFQERNRNHSPRMTIPSANFYGEPVGYSTPQYSPHSRQKRRSKEVERPRKGARKRLEFDDSENENESEEEVRCRCMEKVWRCRRKKPMYPSYDDDYLPCFMRFPSHPYYF